MTKKIDLNISVKEKNDRIAAENRARFNQLGLKVFNLIGSPGCGKTALLEATAHVLKERLAVIEGDVYTALDAERIQKHGSQAVQIQTGGSCHLNAEMVRGAFEKIDPSRARVLFIENVGNLVCPAGFDLGEHAKIAMISLPEGDEKPVKYPALFTRAQSVVIGKTDLRSVLEFSVDRVKADCLKLNPKAVFFELSSKTGRGLDAWLDYLIQRP